MHLFVIPRWITTPLFIALAGLALWRGGNRERVVAVAQAVEMVESGYICRLPGCRFEPHWLWAAMLIWRLVLDDGVILVICLACLVRADRYWCVWACSFALLGVVSDLTAFVPGISRWAWLSASLVWSYAVAGAVLWGVLTHRRTAAA